MRRRNDALRLIIFLLATLALASSQPELALSNQSPASTASDSQSAAPATSSQPPSGNTQSPSDKSASAPAPSESLAAPTASPDAPPKLGQNPDASDSGVFVFRKEVEEVVLHATVVDDKQRIVTTLDKSDFNVFEDGHPQTITSFRHEDIPVAMGIVVDNSGSMREKRQK